MADLDDLFAELRPLLARHASALVVRSDEPGNLEMATTKVGPSGTALGFGAVKTGTSHVSVQVMALASHPELLADVSAPLRELMHGKGAFNFTPQTISPELLEELSALVDAGLARYRADGLA